VLGIALSSFGADGTRQLIIDVRTEAEWNNGHIEGAILIPYESIGQKIGQLPKTNLSGFTSTAETGRRSQIAKATIEKLGYKDVVNLDRLKTPPRR